MNYTEFIKTKETNIIDSGFAVNESKLNKNLFDFQKALVSWALQKGKSSIFANCGLGKTIIQLEWAQKVFEKTNKSILILAPLAVSKQTKREGVKFDICDVNICNSQNDIKKGINITNYEKLHKFDASTFIGIVGDESGIIKNYSGKIRNQIINMFQYTKYKLACTATPSPNDYMELGNHSEFMNVMSRSEMLAMFFIHDSGDTAKWRLKGHAENKFWEWLCTWSVMFDLPSDIGFNDDKFILPELKYHNHIIKAKTQKGRLFPSLATTLNDRRKVRSLSLKERCEMTAELVNDSDDSWIVWCDLNNESTLLKKLIYDSVEVKGSDSIDHKENSMLNFSDDNIKCLVTKPSIAGHGMNWQNSYNMAFVGLSDSYEKFYQAVRREWRFGQTKPVNVHIITNELEGNVLKNIKRKDKLMNDMKQNMINHMSLLSQKKLKHSNQYKTNYKPNVKMEISSWM